MNEHQEALNTLYNHAKETKSFGGKKCVDVARKTIQKLTDKVTPIKPIKEDGLLLCGTCKNHTVAIEGYTGEEWCCYTCGQVIDWDIDND